MTQKHQKTPQTQTKKVFDFMKSPVFLVKILHQNDQFSSQTSTQISSKNNSKLLQNHSSGNISSFFNINIEQQKNVQKNHKYHSSHFNLERSKYANLKKTLGQNINIINESQLSNINPSLVGIYKQNILQLFFKDFHKQLQKECRQKADILQFIWNQTFYLLQSIVEKIVKNNINQQKKYLHQSIQAHNSYQSMIQQCKVKQKHLTQQLKYNKIFIDSLIYNIRYKKKQIKQLKVGSKLLVNQLNDFKSLCVDLKAQNIGMLMSWQGITQQQAGKLQLSKINLRKQNNFQYKLIKQKQTFPKNKTKNISALDKTYQSKLYQNHDDHSMEKSKLYLQIQNALINSNDKNIKSCCSIIDTKIQQYQFLHDQIKQQQIDIGDILKVAITNCKFYDASTDTNDLKKIKKVQKSQQINLIEKYQMNLILNRAAQTHQYNDQFYEKKDVSSQTSFIEHKKYYYIYHQFDMSILDVHKSSKKIKKLRRLSPTNTPSSLNSKSVSPSKSNSKKYFQQQFFLKQKQNKIRQLSLYQNRKYRVNNSQLNKQRNRFASVNQQNKNFKQKLLEKKKIKKQNLKQFGSRFSVTPTVDNFMIHQPVQQLQVINQNQFNQSQQQKDNIADVVVTKKNLDKFKFSRFSQLSKKKSIFNQIRQKKDSVSSVKSYVSSIKSISMDEQQQKRMQQKIKAVKILRRFSNIRQSLIIDHTIDQYFKEIQINQCLINDKKEISQWQKKQVQQDILKLIGSLIKVRKEKNFAVNNKGLIKILSIVYAWAIQTCGKGKLIKNLSYPLHQYLELMYGSVKGINIYSRMLNFLANCHFQSKQSSLIKQFLVNTNIDFTNIKSLNSITDEVFQKRNSFEIELHLKILSKLSVNYAPLMSIDDLYTTSQKIKSCFPQFLKDNKVSSFIAKEIQALLESKILDTVQYKKRNQKGSLKLAIHQSDIDIFKCSSVIINSFIQIRNRYVESYRLFQELYHQATSFKDKNYSNLSFNFLKYLIQCHILKKDDIIKQFKLLNSIQQKEKKQKRQDYSQFVERSQIFQLSTLASCLEQKYYKIDKNQINKLKNQYINSLSRLPYQYKKEEFIDQTIIKRALNVQKKQLEKDKKKANQAHNVCQIVLLKIAEKRVDQFLEKFIGQDFNFFYGVIICSLSDFDKDQIFDQ